MLRFDSFEIQVLPELIQACVSQIPGVAAADSRDKLFLHAMYDLFGSAQVFIRRRRDVPTTNVVALLNWNPTNS